MALLSMAANLAPREDVLQQKGQALESDDDWDGAQHIMSCMKQQLRLHGTFDS